MLVSVNKGKDGHSKFFKYDLNIDCVNVKFFTGTKKDVLIISPR